MVGNICLYLAVNSSKFFSLYLLTYLNLYLLKSIHCILNDIRQICNKLITNLKNYFYCACHQLKRFFYVYSFLPGNKNRLWWLQLLHIINIIMKCLFMKVLYSKNGMWRKCHLDLVTRKCVMFKLYIFWVIVYVILKNEIEICGFNL